ncbi:MAG: nitric-oxide reductase large subunit [Acidobacteriota bacterium]|nr:nitric-oxide reductase large subunit [Acidobacteriota bacterium]
MQYRKLWITLGLVVAISFLILGIVGYQGITTAPPIPKQVVTTDGVVLFDETTIRDGQNVWQSIGGQEIGSIFGHGAYVAPDWTADYLHREATLILRDQNFATANADQQAALRARLQSDMRRNTWDSATGVLTISNGRARAFEELSRYYAGVFRDGRKEYAIPTGALTDEVKLRQMSTFFFWTAWVATTERPGTNVTYTQNWPHEELVGNRPTAAAIMWSIASVVLLLAGIGGMIWYFGARTSVDHAVFPETDPLLKWIPTPSQRATMKYFLVVVVLFLVQIAAGALTAHYAVEGDGLFGIPLDQILPYSIVRTWHLQIGIFWIATAWLATGLYIAPAIGGREPKGQRLGVNVLFGALIVVVAGSLTGEWLGIKQKLGTMWFWLGAQGYEYVDLGRLWQILLTIGLVFWLFLMARAIWPAIRQRSEDRSLLILFMTSAVAIPLFYSAGLMYGQRSHIVTAEYWRWWVVHLWVEGFFEVFATAVIAFLFTRLGVLTLRTATKATLFSTIIYLGGGIVGTFHHLYFTGMSSSVLALGAVFSALEIVPLCLVGFEAWEHIRLSRGTSAARWLTTYKWPIYFFVAVAFWNLVGAGLFGFLINPPIALYYMQGLNLTPVHGHTALFGVYGMLAIGLMLFSLRAMKPGPAWKEWPVRFAFWSINIGLTLMCIVSILPIGIAQTVAAIEHGTWYARSAEFLQTPWIQNVRWSRVVGDSLFTAGALVLAWFVFGIFTGRSFDREVKVEEAEASVDARGGTVRLAPANKATN